MVSVYNGGSRYRPIPEFSVSGSAFRILETLGTFGKIYSSIISHDSFAVQLITRIIPKPTL